MGQVLVLGDAAGLAGEYESVETLPETLDGDTTLITVWPAVGASPEEALQVASDGLAQLQWASGRDNLNLIWCTRDALSVSRNSAAAQASAGVLWGLARVARAEDPDLSLRMVDSLDEVTAETLGLADEPECAQRGDDVLVPRLVSHQPPQPSGSVVSGEGAVLITGGLGALGRSVARWLAGKQGVTQLILTSRRGAQTPGAGDLVEELQAWEQPLKCGL